MSISSAIILYNIQYSDLTIKGLDISENIEFSECTYNNQNDINYLDLKEDFYEASPLLNNNNEKKNSPGPLSQRSCEPLMELFY
ncbi:6512_t:CDS:2 [Gigaspora margarita]|uniref:6512_t:CDS:1 n=1 Tax=Gigaspora margarita TaxID=4874 RepID=A0ABN7V4Q4_GIGMA|nr:6512_t:CDS:2 [Gigaspora margarita]